MTLTVCESGYYNVQLMSFLMQALAPGPFTVPCTSLYPSLLPSGYVSLFLEVLSASFDVLAAPVIFHRSPSY